MKAFAGLSSSDDDSSDEEVAEAVARPEASSSSPDEDEAGADEAPVDPEAAERAEKRFRAELERVRGVCVSYLRT